MRQLVDAADASTCRISREVGPCSGQAAEALEISSMATSKP